MLVKQDLIQRTSFFNLFLDYAGPMTETVLMGNLAIRSYMLGEKSRGRIDYYARKKLLWDGENMKITNLEAANQFVSREYRTVSVYR